MAVSFFFSFKSCSVSCKFALSIYCSINDLLYPRVLNWVIIFAVWLKNSCRFVLSVKLVYMVCYLWAISSALIGQESNFVGPFIFYILLFVAYYFDLCRLEHPGIQFLFVSTWIRIWRKLAFYWNNSWSLTILVLNLSISWRARQ